MLIFSYPSVLTYVLGAQKNRLVEYPQYMFWLRNKKIIFRYAFLTKGLLIPNSESSNVLLCTILIGISDLLNIERQHVIKASYAGLTQLLLLLLTLFSPFTTIVICLLCRERSGSVVECLTRDRRAAGMSLTSVTALWSLSKTHLS